MPWRSNFLVLSCTMCFVVNLTTTNSELFFNRRWWLRILPIEIEMVLLVTDSYGSSISRRVLTIRSFLIITLNSGKEPLKNKWIYSRDSAFEESWQSFFSIERSEAIPVSTLISKNCPMYWVIRGWLRFDIDFYTNQWVVSWVEEG